MCICGIMLINKIIYYLIFITFIAYSSCCQTIVKNKMKDKVDTSEYLIDPIEEMPFVIERENIYSVIPESLGKKLSGFAGLRLYISNKGIMENFELVKLSLDKDGTSFIEYQHKKFGFFKMETYPKDIQKYYQFLENYVKKLKVRQVTGVIPRSVILNLLVRFK